MEDFNNRRRENAVSDEWRELLSLLEKSVGEMGRTLATIQSAVARLGDWEQEQIAARSEPFDFSNYASNRAQLPSTEQPVDQQAQVAEPAGLTERPVDAVSEWPVEETPIASEEPSEVEAPQEEAAVQPIDVEAPSEWRSEPAPMKPSAFNWSSAEPKPWQPPN